ncbi:response regulator transcription factor [uncultured Pluralibacter sp.]|uniref:helix-turn-helix domain-containing protein n=1 Tax=uncultured Pluralibacter sp. TaxID=1490864 RepID=UPI00260CB71A|nr:response regulator transcription factor [uncultured Pluralibacter sp.]
MKMLYVGIDNLSCNGMYYILKQYFVKDDIVFASIESDGCTPFHDHYDIIILDCEAVSPHLDTVSNMFSGTHIPVLVIAVESNLLRTFQNELPSLKGMINRNVNAGFLAKAIELIVGGGYCFSWNISNCVAPAYGNMADDIYEKAGLTRREKEILRLCLAGETNKSISHKLSRSEKTISSHKSNIFKKLGIKSWQLKGPLSKKTDR